MREYILELPEVEIEEDWTNYSRHVMVRYEHAPGNRVDIHIDANFNEEFREILLTPPQGFDIIVTVDNRDETQPTSFRGTAGADLVFQGRAFSLFTLEEEEETPYPVSG
jgi:hypothetical protein